MESVTFIGQLRGQPIISHLGSYPVLGYLLSFPPEWTAGLSCSCPDFTQNPVLQTDIVDVCVDSLTILVDAYLTQSLHCYCYCSVAKSCLTLQLHGLQHTRLPCSSLSPGICSNSCPLSQWSYLTISYSAALFFFCPQSFLGSFPMSLLCIRWPKYWSFSFNNNPFNEYSGLIFFRMDWFDLLAVQWDSQESSLTSQFKRINSPALSLLYGKTLTSVHDYWKKHSFDCMDLCQQSDVSDF